MYLFMEVAVKMTLSAALDFCAGISLMRWVINNNDSAFAFQGGCNVCLSKLTFWLVV